jgi:YVTN family beta-propeller protein
MFLGRGLVIACAAVALGSGLALADTKPGEIGPSLGLTANGRKLNPVGRMTQVGNFPTGSALTKDGRFLWVVDSGHGSDDVRVMNVATGQVLQTLPLPGAYEGIAFAPDGKHAYVSGTPKGGSPTEGPTKGDQGDVIHVYSVDAGTGKGTEQNPIQLPKSSGGSGRTKALPPVSGVGSAWPEGLAISEDGRYLVVALNQADKAAVIDLKSGGAKLVSTGAYPAGVAFDHRGRAFVSNEYDGTVTVIDPAAAKVTATIKGLGGPGGDQNSHPEGMVTDPTRGAIYVAVTNRDLVATIDTGSLKVSRTVSVARSQGVGTAPVNLAVDPDGHTLYVADAGEDAVAVISLSRRPGPGARVIPHRVVKVRSAKELSRYRKLSGRTHSKRKLKTLRKRYLLGTTTLACKGPSRAQEKRYDAAALKALSLGGSARRRALAKARAKLTPLTQCAAAPDYIPNLSAGTLIGRLPTAAYTSSVQVTPNGDRLLWVAAKGLGAGPNPTYYFDTGGKAPGQTPQNTYGTYVLDKLLGQVGALPTPSDKQARAATALADAAVKPQNSTGAPAGTPVQAPDGGPSQQIKHVFYVVKENRTYDQLFGTESRGAGDPALELFDDNGVPGPTGGITPNAHALTRKFPLIDHFYADSEVSVDGHIITSGGYATDYVQKALAANYSGRPKGMDFGVYPVTFPPNDFIFDQAVKQGISFRNYGEAAAGNTPLGNDGRSTFGAVTLNTDNTYPNNVFIGCLAAGGAVGNHATCTQDSGVLNGLGVSIGAQSRFNVFQAEFLAQVATNSVPTLNYMILPNDHTNGTTTNDYTPQAMIADNDLALGQVVDLISHSAIWSSSAIIVVEDDSQDGADHVDAHRMPAYVISPWAKRGAVVSTRYDQYSALRTVELMVGLHPLSLNDALATPMYDCFDTTPDVAGTIYTAITPTQSLGAINKSTAADSSLSNKLPWDDMDLVPQAVSDQILWHAVHGKSSTPPAPGPDASPVEHQRATTARALIARHGDVREYLESTGNDDD